MGSSLASGARGPRFDPRSRRRKFRSQNTLSLVSFAGMQSYQQRRITRIGMHVFPWDDDFGLAGVPSTHVFLVSMR